MVKVHIGQICHVQALHHGSATAVICAGDRPNIFAGKPDGCPFYAFSGGLGYISIAPGFGCQAPADFELVGNWNIRRTADHSTPADQLIVRFPDQRPEAIAIFFLKPPHSDNQVRDFFPRHDRSQSRSDLGVTIDRVESIEIILPPVTHDQSISFYLKIHYFRSKRAASAAK